MLRSENEISSLKSVAQSLRDELDKAHVHEENRVRDAYSAAHAENNQLKLSLQNLRTQLEQTKNMQEDLVQRTVSKSEAEKKTLRETIETLREELEGAQHKESESIQKAEARSASEIKSLKDTLSSTREKIDQILAEKNALAQIELVPKGSGDQLAQAKHFPNERGNGPKGNGERRSGTKGPCCLGQGKPTVAGIRIDHA